MKVKHDYPPGEFEPGQASSNLPAMKASEIRRARGLTQVQLAERIGESQTTISRFENGDEGATIRTARAIAEALNCTVADLFDDDRRGSEQILLDAFRRMPPDRQRGWLDMAMTIAGPPTR